MEFKEIKNDVLEVKKIKMRCDNILCDNKGKRPPYPLIDNSGFCIWINGFSGSGKTTLLMNMLCKRNKDGNKTSYRGVFDNIIYVNPSSKTLPKNNEFSKLDDSKKFKEINEDLFDLIDELDEEDDEDEPKSILLVLDDVSSQLKRNKYIEKKLGQLLQNRRHIAGGLSAIFITQKLKDCPTNIRNNINMLITFKPKNKPEYESIIKEYLNMKADEARELFNYVFQDKNDFLIIDMTLRKGGDFLFFRNFNLIEIINKNKISNNNINNGEEREERKENKESENKD